MEEATFKLNPPETKTTPEGANLVLKAFKSLGHQIRYYVSATSADFNKLDTKRPDACNEEATANIVYRSMHPDLRYWFLHGREAEVAKDGAPAITEIKGVESEVLGWDIPVPPNFTFKDKSPVESWARATKVAKNAKGEVRKSADGTDIEVFDTAKESEDDYYSRILAMSVAAKKFASEDAARDHWQTLAETIALEIPFDVEARERVSRLPARLPAKDKMTAAVLLVRGKATSFITDIFSQVRKDVVWEPTGDTTKMYVGKATVKGQEVDFNVSDKDAESLGRLVKEYREWKDSQVGEALVA